MDKKNVPLIIPNFNQLFYLKNLINWWQYYYPNNPVFIIDNKSNYKPLLDYYNNLPAGVTLVRCSVNNCGENLKKFLDSKIHDKYKYYAISNPDVMPHPGTPENFLKVMIHALETTEVSHKGHIFGLKKVGFALIVDDLPDYIDNKDQVLIDQIDFWKKKIIVSHEGKIHYAHQAPIDLTFAVYSSEKGGWIPKKDLDNIYNWHASLRMFKAFHLGWYIEPGTKVEETINYFKTAKCKANGDHLNTKGVNTYRPKTFM